ncbi:MAG: diaminopimelate decarboxylase [Clostridia bacterium]|nr:diaminopimelate decarboxylase [Clostridia bacterium]
MICDNISINEAGHLCFAGQDTVELASQYGTPLYLMDADRIRHNCRTYISAMQQAYGDNFEVIYAGKAASFKQMYRIMAQEGMSVDSVSVGEIFTALSAGFPAEHIHFHGNNKTERDLAFALDQGVGTIVVDNTEELTALNEMAGDKDIKQNILLRLTPGIDTHTYEAVSTGKVDSKFGFAIETGQAEEATKLALSMDGIVLEGFHCHVGSQVFDSDSFVMSATIMLRYIKEIQTKYGYTAKSLDLGGGYGVRYLETDPYMDIRSNILRVADHIKATCKELDLPVPKVMMEPGRSIVADAGMTLYTVGTVKEIPGYKNYVAIDGGMTDNPRYALYESEYTVMAANQANEPCDKVFDLVGRCCESGDIIQPAVSLPRNVQKCDLIAVLTTGAYNYSMSSNYNRFLKPPVVMLEQGESRMVVRRETLDDLIQYDF